MSSHRRLVLSGDIHGQLDKLVDHLRAAGLIDADQRWIGGAAQLWFMGDFFDRGPDGLGAVDLVMRLQAEAESAGGHVDSLLGNHDVLIMAAHRFGDRPTGVPGETFLQSWQRNGGERSDLDRLSERHMVWLSERPPMALVEDRLLIHADATFYQDYGSSIDSVNATWRALLGSDDLDGWHRLLDLFSSRFAFSQPADAQAFLDRFGGRQIIHGHTPIGKMTGQRPETVTEPYVYADGLCINLDGGMYLGGPGFLYEV